MATPEENVDAWAKLMAQLQAQVLATRENAKAMLSAASRAREYRVDQPEWEATAWAAGRLLADLQHIAGPVVPEEPERGQQTIQEAIDLMAAEERRLGPQGVEKPVDFPRKRGAW